MHPRQLENIRQFTTTIAIVPAHELQWWIRAVAVVPAEDPQHARYLHRMAIEAELELSRRAGR